MPEGARHRAVVLGAERAFCCTGCEAVARTIVEAGFEKYYETRTAPGQRPPDFPVEKTTQPGPRLRGGDIGEASLVLEGVRCSACLWLIENALRRAPGVVAADVNYATRRALVRWDPGTTDLERLIGAIRAVGYGAAPYAPGVQAEAERRERRAALFRLFIAGFGAMQVMMYAFPAYTGDAPGPEVERLMRWAGLLITAPVLVFACGPFFRGAWAELRGLRPGLETPIALGLAGAFAASAWATWTGTGEVYFDSVSMLAFLLLAARFAENAVRRHASRQLDPLLQLSAGGPHAVGDRILVAPGERIPADGVVLQGASAADESLLTGESRPVPKAPGDAVVAGSVNLDQPITIEATRVGEQTRAAGIARLVERAQSSRPALVQAADRVARPLTLVVLVIAGITFAFSGPWAAVAVLVVTCPCALALASPVVLTRACAVLLGRGVLVTRSRVLQALDGVTDVLVDKTGTLTQGRLRLRRTVVLGDAREKACLDIAAALEAASRHPIARAFGPSARAATDLRYVAGLGVEGELEGRRVRLGAERFCAALAGSPAPCRPEGEGTVVYLADARGWLAAFALEDALRPDAAALVRELRARGLEVHLLSGDAAPAVGAVARATGIGRWRAERSPEGKLAYVRRLQAQGRRVLMIGDGLNDGPVLAAADASIALGSGADSTQLQADVVLLGDALREVPRLMAVAGKTLRLVRQNIGWALAYNATALPVAAFGLIGPLEAALGMGASSIMVLLNALRPLEPRRTEWKASTSSSPSPSPSYS